jgi:hypothetical protein
VKHSVVYGPDDRVEAVDASSGLREVALASTAVLMPASLLVQVSEQASEVRAPALQDQLGLCPGQPFAEQPQAAFCTAVLVDENTVLTAGHCITEATPCDEHLVIAFEYVATPESARVSIANDALFTCAQVLWSRNDANGSLPNLDFAFLRLSRRAPDRLRALTIGKLESSLASEALATIGASQGLPLKVDEQARLLPQLPPDARLGFFNLTTDAFHGCSGGPVLTSDGELVGILASGQSDYVRSQASHCSEIHHDTDYETRDDSGTAEQATFATSALAELCATAPLPLCATTPACRDDGCASLRTPALPEAGQAPDPAEPGAASVAPAFRATGGCALTLPDAANDRLAAWFVVLALAAKCLRKYSDRRF